MNEIQLLRDQLATERRHVREVASACAAAHLEVPADAAALAPLREACTEYLRCVLTWFDQRDDRLGELYGRPPPGDAERKALAALAPGGRGREALERLAAGGAARDSWTAFAQFITGAWDGRRGAIEALLASNPRVSDWRGLGIDADSVHQERALYARVRAALPPGIELA